MCIIQGDSGEGGKSPRKSVPLVFLILRAENPNRPAPPTPVWAYRVCHTITTNMIWLKTVERKGGGWGKFGLGERKTCALWACGVDTGRLIVRSWAGAWAGRDVIRITAKI